MESVNSTIHSPIDRTAALSVLPGSSQTYDPRLLPPLTKSLTMRVMCMGFSQDLDSEAAPHRDEFLASTDYCGSSSNILRILRHLREHVWYLP